jgi:uncharacterized peroxidase-related enzyme
MSEFKANADVIDLTANLKPSSSLYAARRYRDKVVLSTQASYQALLHEPVAGLGTADRLRVALHCCQLAQAAELAAHYRAALLASREPGQAAPAALQAALHWAGVLTIKPRAGDRAALQALQKAGLSDTAIVALAQLVAFLSYQTRVVAGLKALAQVPASGAAGAAGAAESPVAGSTAAAAVAAQTAAASGPTIRINGFTNEALGWKAWLSPLDLSQASPLQLEVLDESHAQARTSAYYLTLAHQALMLRHRSVAYNAIMYAAGGAPRAERELAAMVVSVTNGCVYCTSVHAQRYAQLARRHDTVEQVFTDPATAGSNVREKAVVTLVRAITLRPQALGAADMAPLRALALRDEEILDVVHAAAIFGWANRLMHNLGEPEHKA